MTLTGVYIRIVGSTKPPHCLPHFVLDSLLLQEVAYQTFINGVVASLHKHKKGVWPQFPLITQVGKIENFKQAREEVNILSSYKFQEVSLVPFKHSYTTSGPILYPGAVTHISLIASIILI